MVCRRRKKCAAIRNMLHCVLHRIGKCYGVHDVEQLFVYWKVLCAQLLGFCSIFKLSTGAVRVHQFSVCAVSCGAKCSQNFIEKLWQIYWMGKQEQFGWVLELNQQLTIIFGLPAVQPTYRCNLHTTFRNKSHNYESSFFIFSLWHSVRPQRAHAFSFDIINRNKLNSVITFIVY